MERTAKNPNSERGTRTRSLRAERVPALPEIETRLEELKTLLSKGTTGLQTDTKGDVCHICSRSYEPKYVIKCGSNGCNAAFCLLCAVEAFKKDPIFVYLAFKSARWNCFACQKLCNCNSCEEANRAETQVDNFQTEKLRKTSTGLRTENESSRHAYFEEYKTEVASEDSESLSLDGNLEIARNKKMLQLPKRKIKAKIALQKMVSSQFGKDDASDDDEFEFRVTETILRDDGLSRYLNRKKRLWKQQGPVNNQLSAAFA